MLNANRKQFKYRSEGQGTVRSSPTDRLTSAKTHRLCHRREFSTPTGRRAVGDVLDLICAQTIRKARFRFPRDVSRRHCRMGTRSCREGQRRYHKRQPFPMLSRAASWCSTRGTRVFIPASQAHFRGDGAMPAKGQEIRFRIIEIGPRHRVVGSARAVLKRKGRLRF